jgi:hypothetical protein
MPARGGNVGSDGCRRRVQKTVSLSVSQSSVLHGRAVTLFGSVANGQLGDAVTVMEHQLPAFSGVEVRAVATVQTNAEGSFNLLVRPASHTLYTASNGHRFVLRGSAARSFVGRYGVVQRWGLRRHHWLSLRRVFFTRAFPGVPPTVTSRAVFRARLGRARIRLLIPRSPGYLTGVSNVLSAQRRSELRPVLRARLPFAADAGSAGVGRTGRDRNPIARKSSWPAQRAGFPGGVGRAGIEPATLGLRVRLNEPQPVARNGKRLLRGAFRTATNYLPRRV